MLSLPENTDTFILVGILKIIFTLIGTGQGFPDSPGQMHTGGGDNT